MNKASVQFLPCTGIQLVRLAPFTVDDIKQWKAPRFRIGHSLQSTMEPVDDTQPQLHDPGLEELSPFDDGGQESRSPEESEHLMQADVLRAIDVAGLHDGWLPLPVSARSALWAMLWVRRGTVAQDGEAIYDAVIAIDTHATPNGACGTLCGGGPDGLGDLPNDFHVEPFKPNNFWKLDAIERFIDRSFERMNASGQWGQTPKTEQTRGALQGHLVGLYNFMVARGLPTIHIGNMPNSQSNSVEDRDPSLNITLVVDLGNSRTCGLLVEADTLEEGSQRFTQLELCRLPRIPTVHIGRPFATHLAFVPPGFGVLEGDDVATFRDLSVVRLGDDAIDLFRMSDADFRVRGMSSPKRYMWDGERRREPWVLAQTPGESDSSMIWGDLLSRLGVNNPLEEPNVPQPDQIHPIRPDYPRKAGTLFAFVEILEQAFRQVNAPEYRRAHLKQPGSQRRRVIRQVVVMHPAGMHSREVREFKTAIERAIQVWTEFRTDPIAFRQGRPVPIIPSLIPRPTLHVPCDEGFAIQACFLYAETIGRFHEDTDRLLRTYGHIVDGRPTLRLASIDVGGGTIDIAIADYSPPRDSEFLAQPTYEARRLFHDGISKAGDDIIRAILERPVFESIVLQMGVPEDRWNLLFSPASGEDDAAWAVFRRRLVSGLWLPLVHQVLSALEENKPVRDRIGNLLKTRDGTAIDELNRRLREIAVSGKHTSIEDVVIDVTPAHIYKAARQEVGTPIRQYADIIAQFRCDAVVVGGRASSIPAVRKLIVESFPGPPGSVVFLHEQSFGKWYPFSVDGRVGDSKTCAVVGAAIVFQAQHGLGRMVLREDAESFQEVPNILGQFNEGLWQLHDNKVWFQKDQCEARVDVQGVDVHIGARRIDSRSAMARPVYRLALDQKLKQWQSNAPQRQEPLLVRLKRMAPTGDDLRIVSVEGEWKALRGERVESFTNPDLLKRAVKCHLQTLIQLDHWLDSGCFGTMRLTDELP
jgi:hypothetical protein